jgi:glycosyltransferase involved in cell wall biosynthesis
VPPGTEFGGAGKSLIECIDALASRGHESYAAVAALSDGHAALARVASVDVCPHNRWLGAKGSLADRGRWIAYDIAQAVPALARIIESHGIDVVITNTMTAMVGGLAARRALVPHSWYFREYPTPERNLHYVLNARSTFWAMRRLTRVSLAVSRPLADHIRPNLEGVALHVVSPAVCTYPPEPPRHAPADDGPFQLLMLGSIIDGKGQVDAVRALEPLRAMGIDGHLTIVGDPASPADMERLMAAIAETSVSDCVTIFPGTSDITQFVSASHALLMCSRDEGFGRVTIEAMKSGVPVIGALSGATRELIDEGVTGLLYTPGDQSHLATQISVLASDRPAAVAMGQRAADWAVANFNIERLGSELEAALAAAVSAGPC